MDVRTLRSLEWDRVLALLSLCASTHEGKRRLEALTPETDVDKVRVRHRRVSECGQGEALCGRLSLEGYQRTPTRIPGGMAFPIEVLRSTRASLRAWRRAEEWLRDEAAPKPALLEGFPPAADAANAWRHLEKILDDRGQVADGASEKLRSIRRERESARSRVLSRMESLVDSLGTTVLREATYTVRNGRLVLPVQVSRKGSVKGILHDTSSTGATAFIEPMEVVDLNNRLTALDAEEREEIQRILVDASSRIAAASEAIEAAFDFVEELDVDLACARFGKACRGGLPQIDEAGRMVILRAFHPLLDPALNGLRKEAWGEAERGEAVPLDIEMSLDGTRTLVVSGPNAGGKSVALKTVGLLCAMQQAGIPVPAAEGTRMPVFAFFHATVGDTQSILDSLSTFSARMVALRDALADLREPFLIVLDELGSGTDPSEGAALGEAILMDLHRRRGFTLCSTHYEPLKARALVTEGMGNAGMDFAEEDRTPTYRLRMGQVGTSRALEIAERSGLPADLLATARALLPEGEKHLRDVLTALEEEIGRHDALKAELRAKIDEQAAEKARMSMAVQALEREKKRFVEGLDERFEAVQERFLAELKAEVNRQSVKRIGSKARIKAAKAASESLGLTPVREASPALPEVGARIKVSGMGITGDVVSVDTGSGRVTVDCDGKTLHVGAGDIEVLEPARQSPARRAGGVDSGTLDASWEINLIGQSVAEAEASLVPFLDRAAMAGLRQVRIIHGIGTGRLKAAVRELVRHSPLVAEWEDAPPSGGGPGATLVRMKD